MTSDVKLLYALDVYTSTLLQIGVDGKTIHSKRVLLDGAVPWYIDHQGDIIVGERSGFWGRQFYNYYIGDTVRTEPNQLLNELQPSQYTFDDADNAYLLFGNMLKKVTPTGKEEFSVVLPGEFKWNTRLHYNSADDRIYYFDEESNSVIRANRQGAETYHRFSSKVTRAFLATTHQGKIYAALVSLDGAKLIEISDTPQERVIWSPPYKELFWFQIASDVNGNLYAALGPVFQQVLSVNPLKGEALSMVQESPLRYDMGFVDPQGFTVTASGTVVLSAPGVLVGFSRR